MIRHSPAENYYKYLVVHPKLYDNAFIKNVASELKLDYLGDWYIQWLRERYVPPTPFYPEDARHTRSQRFLLKEGLDKIFNPNSAMVQAQRILAKPRWRETVETLILSRAPDDGIVHAMRARFGTDPQPEAIRLFRHYFWRVDLLDSLEMRALLDMRHHGTLEADDKDAQLQHLSIKRVRFSDPRAVAARLPTSPLSAVLAQLELGVLPKRVDIANVLDQTFNLASMRLFETVASGTNPQQIAAGQSLSMIAEAALRLKAAVVNPEDKLREDLRKISLATSTRKVPTVHTLTAGRHTTNVHPDPKPSGNEEEYVEAEGETVEE